MQLETENYRHPILLYLCFGLAFLFWENLISGILGIYHFELRRTFWGAVYYPLLFLFFGVLAEGINFFYCRCFPRYAFDQQRYVWFLFVIIAFLWGGLWHRLLVVILDLQTTELSYGMRLLWPAFILTCGVAVNLAVGRWVHNKTVSLNRSLFAWIMAALIYLIISSKVTYRFFLQSEAPRYSMFYNAFAPENLLLQPLFMLLAAGITFAILRGVKSFRVFHITIVGIPVLVTLLVASVPTDSSNSIPRQNSQIESDGKVRRPNVVIMLFDALRADHVGAISGKYGLTPWMNELGELGKVYPSCYSTSSWTVPAVASLFTSRLPNTIGLIDLGMVPEEVPTLTDLLRTNGYRTGAYTANAYISEVYGFDRSYDEFLFLHGKGPYQLFLPFRTFFASPRISGEIAYEFGFISNDYLCARGADMTRKAISFLEQKSDKPFFLYLHYNEPHTPYYAKPYRGKLINPELIQRLSTHFNYPDSAIDTNVTETSGVVAKILHERYMNGVRVADQQVKKIWSAIRKMNLADDTMIIIVADHGEGFLEHGQLYHKSSLFEEEVKVPLIIRIPPAMGIHLPDQTAGVSLLDVAPTILDLAGIDWRSLNGDGRSLLESDHGEVLPKYMSLKTGEELWASMVMEPYKLILIKDVKTGSADTLLYNLELDPQERTNLCLENRETASRMALDLEKQLNLTSHPHEVPRRELTPFEIQRLRSLGYVN